MQPVWKYERFAVLGSVVAVVAFTSSCASPWGTTCEAGETQLCHCSVTTQGLQLCREDGTGWQPCDCDDDDPDDPSTDHAMTGCITAEVLISLRAPLIETEYPPLSAAPALFFWETQSGVGFLPEAFVDITEEIGTKEEAVANHKSQLEWTVLPLEEMVRIIAAFRGLQCGCRYAEAFVAHRLYGQMPAYKLLP